MGFIKVGRKKFDVEIAYNSFQKMRGLMFRRILDHALVFKLNKPSKIKASIHSFFVFFPFDVLFLDEGCTVVDAKTVQPWTYIVRPRQLTKFIVELPEGTIAKTKVKEGDCVKFGE